MGKSLFPCIAFLIVSLLLVCIPALFAQDGNFSQPPPMSGFSNPNPQPTQQQPSSSSSQSSQSPTELISANTDGQETVVQSGISVRDDYVIRGSDVISVTVINEPELSVRGVRVMSSGSILMPLLGEVKIEGLSLQYARELIVRKLGQDYLVNPQVVVSLEATSQNEFIMRGQVGGVGVNQIPTDGSITLLKAIYSKGGPTKVANIRRIKVTRKTSAGLQESEYDLRKIQEGKVPDPEILPGDIIFVPENFF